MSIVTKTGDDGATTLMYGRRVPKHHLRVEAYGAVDELNAALGLARAVAADSVVRNHLLVIQKDLVWLMGELAVATKDLPRYRKDGYPVVTPAMTAKLEELVRRIEATGVSAKDWATPGANTPAAALDLARGICRRAERRVCALKAIGGLNNMEIIVYLNRLSDLLWLLARRAEIKPRR